MKSFAEFSLISLLITGAMLFFQFSCTGERSPLNGKTVCLDPGHGGTAAVDSYRVGTDGEREEWIDLRVALRLRDMLEEKGCRVVMTRESDIAVELKKRAQRAVDSEADVFVSIHHNATADTSANFPVVYFHGNASENRASVQLGKAIIGQFRKMMFNGDTPVSLVSDHTIFPQAGTAVLRHSYGIPGIIGEASFFTNPSEEQRLKQASYNELEARAYLVGLENYFSVKAMPVLQKNSLVTVPPFEVQQEAGRMDSIAALWKLDYEEGLRLFEKEEDRLLPQALAAFTRSAQSFPDAWLTSKTHYYRAQIFRRLNQPEKARITRERLRQFYIEVN